MAVYDCCMFLNENDLFEIRLKTHWNFVDKFIVVEAGETHTGDPKPFNFDHERFKPYSEKIIYVKFDNFQEEINKYHELLLDDVCLRDRGPMMETDDWIRDHFQGNYLYKTLLDINAKDSDIVYISCLDELIKESAFHQAMNYFKGNETYNGFRPIITFNCNLFVYKMNLLHKSWPQHLSGTLTEFGNYKKMLPSTLRDLAINTHPPIPDGGYHFTFLDDTLGEKVLAKQKSWAHSRDAFNGKLKYDNKNIYEALDRLWTDYQYTIVPMDEHTHPKCVMDNLEIYDKFIYKPLITDLENCPVCSSRNLIKSPATIDKWTLNRFLRLNSLTHRPQATINHCQDCDYAGLNYRFSKEAEQHYYINYMTGEYLSSRPLSESEKINQYIEWYHSKENVNYLNEFRNNLLSQLIKINEINSILDFGGNTGLMIPDMFKNCKKYIREIEPRNFVNGAQLHTNEKVDFIFCAHTLEHISDIKGTFNKFKEYLNPNGLVYIEVPKEKSEQFNGPYNFQERINLFTEISLKNVLITNGFEVSDVHTLNYKSPMDESIGIIGKLI